MADQETEVQEEETPTEAEAATEGDSEAISDIQNYLASFNKEIQGDGANAANAQTSEAALSPTEAEGSEGEAAATTADGTTTFYVTQTADGFQYATSSQVCAVERFLSGLGTCLYDVLGSYTMR